MEREIPRKEGEEDDDGNNDDDDDDDGIDDDKPKDEGSFLSFCQLPPMYKPILLELELCVMSQGPCI